MTKAAKKKAGRPAKYASKRLTLTTRLQEPIYEVLKSEAEKNGRSISEQIEHRLSRSFVTDKQHAELLKYENEARFRAEDNLEAAEKRIEELELLQLNIAAAIETAIENAFAKAGLVKRKDDQS